MKTLILCDFDGTISVRDMGYVLLNRFSSGDWNAIDRAFVEGTIGSKEAYIRIAKILKGSKDDVLRFIRDHSDIDPHFAAFYQYCRREGIDVKIVSDGLDVYIETMLQIHQLSEIPYYANRSRFLEGGGLEMFFPYSNEDCGLCGTCKKRLVEIHRNAYDRIIYAGNGVSDRCGAKASDFTFAKSALYRYCVEQDIVCHHFQHFGEILADLRKRIRGVIFDLDGTLIEAYEALYLGIEAAFQRFGRTIFPFQDYPKHVDVDLEATLSHFFSPEEVAEAIPIVRKKYEEVYLEKTRFLDGARETVEALHGQGVVLAVASNKFGRFSRGALNHLGVAGYFKAALGAGDVLRNKPFPDMLHAALNEMDLSPEDTVFVGDTLTDIETGQEAGVDVYALPTGFHTKTELSQRKPRRILRNLPELVRVVKDLFSVPKG